MMNGGRDTGDKRAYDNGGRDDGRAGPGARTRRAGDRLACKGGVVAQHVDLERPERGCRLEPKLVKEAPCAPAGFQRLDLPAAAVERQDERGPQALVVGTFRNQRFQLGGKPGAAERRISVDPVRDDRRMQLGEVACSFRSKRRVIEIGERPPAPKREGFGKRRACRLGVSRDERVTPASSGLLETRGVDGIGGDP